jgi:PAS domain S-box-containing protein
MSESSALSSADGPESREELLQELIKTRARLKACEQTIQEQACELDRLSALHVQAKANAEDSIAQNVNACAAEDLQASEERYRTLFASINEGFCVIELMFNPQGNPVDACFLETNPAFNRGNKFMAAKGKTACELMPGLEPQWFDILSRVALSGRSHQAILQSKALGGRWFKIDAFRVGQAHQRRVAVLFNDITEHKRAEQALRESASSYRQTLESIPGMVFTTRPDGYCDYQSRQWVEFTGIPMSEHLGNGWTRLLHPQDRPQAFAAWQAALAGKAPYDLEYRVRRHDGVYEWFRVIARPIRDAQQQIVRWFGVTMNIEKLKQAEEQLKTANENLEQQVAERTALADARARQLQTLAVELIEAEEKERQRISFLLHEDLQQLLASAKMQLAAICATGSNPLLDHVETLLVASIDKSRRLSHELSPPVLQHSDLMPAIQWLVQHAKDQFALEVELAGDPIDLHENAPLKVFVFRAVQQLLLNVAKHAGVKKARIELSAYQTHFTLVVFDDGKGFDPSDLKTEEKTRRLGLGLLSLRERANYIGGAFVIESAPGQGARFTLKLPFGTIAEEPPAKREALPADSPADQKENAVKKMRVLFVDDHQLMRKSLVRLAAAQSDIEIAGEAASGPEAIAFAQRLQPDVVVMDVSMPGMDGIAATRLIKAERPEVRIIGLSMFEDEQVGAAMMQAGAEAVVSKTAPPGELLQAIQGAGRKAT